MEMMELAERDCCERPNYRTVYRGPLGGVEYCERCGFSVGYHADGSLTQCTVDALRSRAMKENGDHGE